MGPLAYRSRPFLPPVFLSLLVLGQFLPLLPRAGEPEPAAVARLAAAGDVILHTPILAAARDPAVPGHDFRPIFAPVRPLLSEADYAVAVLETTLGGPEGGYTGYPRFKSPAEIAEALDRKSVV